MAKRRRKTRTHKKGADSRAPKSFVIRGGKVGKSVAALVRDVRRIMEPNTASRLQERERNKLRDYLTMAGPLGVSHMLIFHQTDAGINMRILRCPRGPTVTFRVNNSRERIFDTTAGDDKHLKLLVSVFQNMFPPLHVHSMRLSQVRRVVLLHYNAETKTIDWRHYLISVRPVGVSRAVRRVIEGSTRPSAASSGSVTGHGGEHRRHGRALVNLGHATDIAEYVMRGSAAMGGEDTDTSEAESEAEDMADPQNAVELAQKYLGRGNVAHAQRAVRLREIGPRMELRLVKIEEGLNGSTVLYHDYVHKTAAEVAQQSREVAERQRLAKERREEQERNVERKKQAKAQRQVTFEEDAPDSEEPDEEEEPLDDEFAYEDAAAGAPANNQAVAQDVLGSDEELFEEEEDYDEEEEEEEEEEDDDDSDLEPIPIGEMEHAVTRSADASRRRAPQRRRT